MGDPELLSTPRNTPRSGAIISPCGRYRYQLWRAWAAPPLCGFVMLNPSTADASVDDPTIRRCVGFARAWGFGGIVVANLFALRATDPTELALAADPIGPGCDEYLLNAAHVTDMLVCAWGVHGALHDRDHAVAKLLAGRELHCLGTTKDGHPRHPLYVSAATERIRFEVRCG